ncbi:hypothetical protein [Enterobacter hormaechei]|uniref:hypothetical protein n=1 Tax=Enterobacter hormaechei TaxID=158836 RepID=UPI000698E6D4|nr:hypothetical protein [Enterobacter hormaechei]
MSELVKRGHDQAAELKSSCGASVAQLISDLATQLDCTALALREMTKKRDADHADVLAWEKTMFKACGEDCLKSVAEKFAELQARCARLAAENAGLKAGPQGFFAYGSDCGYEEFDTAEKAMEFAEAEIADFRDQACDGWSDEVGSVVWGVVLQRATMTGLRPVEEGDNCAEGFKEWCDYTLLPGVETPDTDAFLAEVRASGVEMLARETEKLGWHESTVRFVLKFAAQIRKGAQS